MGLCHLGMIEALEKRGFRPDYVVGTSAGSLVGALYSHFGNVPGVCGRIESVLASDEFDMFERKYFGKAQLLEGHVQRGIKHFFTVVSETLEKKPHHGISFAAAAMIAQKDVASLFTRIFDGITFDTLKIPFATVAVDLSDGVPVTFASEKQSGGQGFAWSVAGPEGLIKAVMASSAIPLLFPSVQLGGHLFVDGGVMTNLPVREARLLLPGHMLLLAGFDVSSPVVPNENDPSTACALRLVDPPARKAQAAEEEMLDVLFRPVTDDSPRSSLSNYKELIELGRLSMTKGCLDIFEKTYRDKCLAMVRSDNSPVRRIFASARIRQLMPQP